MRLKKIIVTGIAAAAVLAIAGCGSSSTGAASSAGETAPYAATDDSWMEAGPGGADSTASEAMTAPTADIEGDSGDLLEYSGAYTEETGKGYSMLLTFTEEDSSVYVSVGHTDEDGTVYYDWEIYGEDLGSGVGDRRQCGGGLQRRQWYDRDHQRWQIHLEG